jgi:hypothetical protein
MNTRVAAAKVKRVLAFPPLDSILVNGTQFALVDSFIGSSLECPKP